MKPDTVFLNANRDTLLFVCQVSTEGTGSRDETGQSVNGQKRADFTFTSANVSGSVCGRQFACAHCQRSYVTKDGLKVHVDRMHKKLYRYRCETCGKGFFGRSVYHDHIAAHTGVKRHTCSICDMKFMNKSTLKVHVLHLHTNVAANIV